MVSLESTDLENWTCLERIVAVENVGQRLDQYLSNCLAINGEAFSRGMFQQLIRNQHVLVQGKPCKNNYRLRDRDCIEVFVPPPQPIELIPEQISFDILYEDRDVIVVSKPPDLVVHPAAGHMTGTLVHGLLYHCTDLSGINGSLRPGIVHRLDKDTSGVMVISKTNSAQQSLVRQFKERKVTKIYRAIVEGVPKMQSGTISTLIGRHHVDRKRMAVINRGGKEAVTHWHCVERFGEYSLLEITLETGRTHQIRVHLAYIGLPIVGDGVYGLRKKQSVYKTNGINRQFLHSCRLSFSHPANGENMQFEAPLSNDIADFVQDLRQRDSAL